MAVLQALLTFLSRSAGKLVNAVFGWAVVALFGQTTPRQKTLLSVVVGLAVVWPLLLLGIAVPRVAALALAFVPMSKQGPTELVRAIWVALALLVPLVVGLTVASKSPPDAPRESFAKKVLRGFPITLGLAAAFVITFVTVPVLRIAAMIKGRKDEHVPLVTSADVYREISDQLQKLFDRHQVDVCPAEPPWWLSAPTRILLKLGGRAFRGFVPARLSYWDGPALVVALYPNDLLLRGDRKTTAWVHGLVAEDLTRSAALQTFDPNAQQVEREIRRVWKVYAENPRAHAGAAPLLERVQEIAGELKSVDLPYEEWSILYRQCVQLERALEGKPQLLSGETEEETRAADGEAGAEQQGGERRQGWLKGLFSPA